MSAIAKALRDAANYERKFGFTPLLGCNGEPRCMVGAINSVVADNDLEEKVLAFFYEQFEINVMTEQLEIEGWTRLDAIAALEMAADIAECECV